MSAIQQAAANTVLRIANLFEQNCALKHGLPKVGGPERLVIDDPEPVPPPPAPINITNNIPAAPAATNSPSPGLGAAAVSTGQSLWRQAAPFLLSAAGVSLPLALWSYMHPQAEQPPATVIQQDDDGSLLQYLEDNGHHLPGDVEWQTK